MSGGSLLHLQVSEHILLRTGIAESPVVVERRPKRRVQFGRPRKLDPEQEQTDSPTPTGRGKVVRELAKTFDVQHRDDLPTVGKLVLKPVFCSVAPQTPTPLRFSQAQECGAVSDTRKAVFCLDPELDQQNPPG